MNESINQTINKSFNGSAYRLQPSRLQHKHM